MNQFPHLVEGRFSVTSPSTWDYNCIAWAAGDVAHWWWPAPGDYWPSSAPREETIEAFSAAFASLGFQPCESGDLEQGFEKLVIYAGTGMVPTHMARQLSSGTWTSKLGRDVDIEHDTPLEVEGVLYGSVVKFLKRPR